MCSPYDDATGGFRERIDVAGLCGGANVDDTPTPRIKRGTAVEVWRSPTGHDGFDYWEDDGHEHPNTVKEPGVWRPQADDALLLGVVEAALRVRDCEANIGNVLLDVWQEFSAALAALTPATTPPTDGGAR